MSNLHICFICVEIFAWGKYGGYGRATRTIGRELVRRGYQVSAIIPRRGNQAPVEVLDGISVYGFDIKDIRSSLEVFRSVKADIYHSQEPSTGTWLAQQVHPEKKHIITFRDTHFLSDWLVELRNPSLNPLQVLFNWMYEDNWWVHRAVHRADARVAAAILMQDRAVRRYHLREVPAHLPTPVRVPERVEKATEPTVCFVARWDRRKRPELALALAKKFPQVRFIIAGASRDKGYDAALRKEFAALPNVELPGLVDQFAGDGLERILSRSWILLNTAAREGLPNSFIEACASRCAILSSVDPDSFASRFGYYAKQDDFAAGLNWLLSEDRWRAHGQDGYEYVRRVYEMDAAMRQHEEVYQKLSITGKYNWTGN
jgi:glycosyltransferase involved in cell wall biosynthesis